MFWIGAAGGSAAQDMRCAGGATKVGPVTLARALDRVASLPVRDDVRSVCDMLGFDPYYLACEGRVVAVVAPEVAEAALAAWRALEQGREAALIGTIVQGRGRVVLTTLATGERILDELEDDPLPRIC